MLSKLYLGFFCVMFVNLCAEKNLIAIWEPMDYFRIYEK